MERIREDVVGGLSIVFTCKTVVDEFSIESLQTYANLLLGLVPANHIPTPCVNPCPMDFLRVGISIQKRVDSHLDKTTPIVFKKWSCLISNEQDLIVKLRVFTLQADRRKLTTSVLMGFVLIAILCLKDGVAFTTFSLSRAESISH